MVQQLYNTVEHLKAEIRRLRGDLNAISTGGKIIPTSLSGGGVQMPLPIEGAILYGTAVPEWGRRTIGAEGEVLTVVSGLPDWAAPVSGGNIEDFDTAEMDDTLVLAPDGLGGVEFRAETGGVNGTGLNIWMPDAPPTSAGAQDDEFDGNSGGVPGGWTEVDHGTGLTVTEDEAGLKMVSTAAAGNAGIYKAIPAGDFTIWTKVGIGGVGLTDFIPAGLALWEDATSSTGDVRVFYLESAAAQGSVIVQAWTAYNAYSSNLATGLISVDLLPSHAYLRIRRGGTSYSFDVSTDGIMWLRLYQTSALGFVPTHYGPALNTTSHATVTANARFPFFRYVASDVLSGGLMHGDRVNGSGVLSDTVEDETTFGITPDAGVSTDYSRGDHTHGTPANPGSGGFAVGTVLQNEFKAWPPLMEIGVGIDLVALGQWFTSVGTPTTALSAVPVSGEAGLTAKFLEVGKCVTDAANEGWTQVATYSVEPRLKSGITISGLIWCGGTAGSVDVTVKLINSDATETLGVVVATDGDWDLYFIEAHVCAGTTVALQVTKDTSGTFYIGGRPTIMIGATAIELPCRKGIYRLNADAQTAVEDLSTQTSKANADLDLTAVSSALAFMAEMHIDIYEPSTGQFAYKVRPNGSSWTTGIATGPALKAFIVPSESERASTDFTILLDSGQIIETELANSGGGTTDYARLYLIGWWEWE